MGGESGCDIRNFAAERKIDNVLGKGWYVSTREIFEFYAWILSDM